MAGDDDTRGRPVATQKVWEYNGQPIRVHVYQRPATERTVEAALDALMDSWGEAGQRPHIPTRDEWLAHAAAMYDRLMSYRG